MQFLVQGRWKREGGWEGRREEGTRRVRGASGGRRDFWDWHFEGNWADEGGVQGQYF